MNAAVAFVRAWWPALLPVGVGVGVAVVLALRDDPPVLTVSGALGLYVLSGAAAVGLVVAVAVAGARRVRAAREAGYRAAEADARDERRRWLLRLDHEFGNPLTAMRAGIANLADRMDGAEPTSPEARALAGLQAQTVRVGRVVARLRELAELETRQIEREPVDLGEVLAEVEEAVRELPEGGDRAIRVSVPQAPWPLPEIRGDRDLLFLAVFNLAANAVKYSADGDTLELRAFEDRDAVVVEVADTGVGIPADEVDLVWEELARARTARTVAGSGLGLPLVRGIVARHDGDVALRSREGEGTVVTLRLPIAP